MSCGTWEQWAERLPAALAAHSDNPIVPWLLTGEFTLDGDSDDEPPFTLEKIKRIKKDEAKMRSFLLWQNTASALKALIDAYAGPEGSALVRGVETKSGDVLLIWNKLVAKYRRADSVGILRQLVNDEWSVATEPPAAFFQRMRNYQRRYNANYRAEALELVAAEPDVDEVTIAELSQGIIDVVFRDMVISRLPKKYQDAILREYDPNGTLAEVEHDVAKLSLD